MQEQVIHIPRLLVHQKVTLGVNRYEVLAPRPGGGGDELVAFAQQKRMKLKEEVVFFADSSRRQRAFSFRSRRALDARSGVDVLDGAGQAIGYFEKRFARSLLRSTWTLRTAGIEARGQERSPAVALARRAWDAAVDVPAPFVYHFDFTEEGSGRAVMTSEKQWGLRDRYVVSVPDPRLDYRVATAMAVALDALQSR